MTHPNTPLPEPVTQRLSTCHIHLPYGRLSDSVRDKVQSAIEALGYRVTTGDVVARAGVKLSQADEALQALCCDSQGALEVS